MKMQFGNPEIESVRRKFLLTDRGMRLVLSSRAGACHNSDREYNIRYDGQTNVVGVIRCYDIRWVDKKFINK